MANNNRKGATGFELLLILISEWGRQVNRPDLGVFLAARIKDDFSEDLSAEQEMLTRMKICVNGMPTNYSGIITNISTEVGGSNSEPVITFRVTICLDSGTETLKFTSTNLVSMTNENGHVQRNWYSVDNNGKLLYRDPEETTDSGEISAAEEAQGEIHDSPVVCAVTAHASSIRDTTRIE